MREVAPGILIKSGTSLGPGPESRLIPAEKDVLKTVVPNKRKPNIPVAPEVPGVTYTPATTG